MKLEQLYNRLVNWLIFYGPRALIAIIVLFLGFWLIRILNKWLSARLEKSRRISPTIRYFFLNLVVIAAQVLLVVFCLQIVRVQLTFLTAIVAGLTVAIGLALSGTLQNFTGGIIILLLKPYRVGDNIMTQGQVGTVTSIQLFFTVVMTFDNTTVIVPNSKLSNEIIINYTRSGRRRMELELKFPHQTDLDRLRTVITTTLQSMDQTIQDRPPRVGITKLEADGYTVRINAWLPAHHFEDNRLQLNERLHREIRNAGFWGG